VIAHGASLRRLHNPEQWEIGDDELFTIQHALKLTGQLMKGTGRT
jgi:hypothetical protein